MSPKARVGMMAGIVMATLVAAHGFTGQDWRVREVSRIRTHIEGAEALLHSRDDSGLAPAQRVARARCIAELRAYRKRGVFPHNHLLRDRRTPVFVDEHGTRCAMAHLIEQSGATSLVSRISSTRNLARIRDLAGDAALGDWLERNGLTLDEAARIQPEYDPNRDGTGETSTTVWAAAGIGAGIGATGAALNLSVGNSQDERNARGLVGVLFGLLGAGLGVPALSEDGGARVLGAVDVGVGLASLGLAMRQLSSGDTRPGTAHAMRPAVWRGLDGVRRVALVVRF